MISEKKERDDGSSSCSNSVDSELVQCPGHGNFGV